MIPQVLSQLTDGDRPEPEAYTEHLAELITAAPLQSIFPKSSSSNGLSVLDLCTGTGCIALLLAALLQSHHSHSQFHGVDISSAAIQLSQKNLRHNRASGHISQPPAVPEQKADNITFSQADIFASLPSQIRKRSWDILVSNPPYVSAHGFAHQTSRSVRNFEPKLAQVPEPRPGFHAPNPSQEADDDRSARACRPEDVFYARLLEIASVLETRVMLFEVGDMDQASRAAAMALGGQYGLGEAKVEIWRDWPDARPEPGEATSLEIRGQRVPVRGSGHGRSVFIVRDCDC
jgi:methylase of polypeptide subunit release factors